MDKTAPHPKLKAIGERLELLREAYELSQTEFARRAGIAQNTYNQYAKGKNLPRLDFAERICDEYGVTLDWIYRGDQSGLPVRVLNLLKSHVVHA
jgi:transcriptional regulator with XRE-family HTH domain